MLSCPQLYSISMKCFFSVIMLYSSARQVICTFIYNLPNVQYYHRLYTGYSKGWNKVRAAIDFALTKSFLRLNKYITSFVTLETWYARPWPEWVAVVISHHSDSRAQKPASAAACSALNHSSTSGASPCNPEWFNKKHSTHTCCIRPVFYP